MHKTVFQMLFGGGVNAYEAIIKAYKKVQTCIIEIDSLLSLDKQYSVKSAKVSQNNLC